VVRTITGATKGLRYRATLCQKESQQREFSNASQLEGHALDFTISRDMTAKTKKMDCMGG
jgi:hypothetical protein